MRAGREHYRTVGDWIAHFVLLSLFTVGCFLAGPRQLIRAAWILGFIWLGNIGVFVGWLYRRRRKPPDNEGL